MRQLCVAVLLLSSSLWAQSLGDVARQQRADGSHPKAKRVLTNADLASGDSGAAAPVAEAPAKAGQGTAPKPTSHALPAPANSRRIEELYHRAQLLQSEITGLQEQMKVLRGSSYGDPNRAQYKQEYQELSSRLESRQSELNAVREELVEESQRAQQSSVMR